MRKLLPSLLFLFAALVLRSQVPQSFNYQAIARDANHQPVGNTAISVDVTILRNGATVYSETNNLTTEPTGLFTIAIGVQNPIDFQAIDWRLGNYDLQISLSGGFDLIAPATPIRAVPYALLADEVINERQQLTLNGNQLSISGGNTVTLNTNAGPSKLDDLSDVNTLGVTQGQVLQWNGTAWAPVTIPSGGTYSAGSGIQINGSTITNIGDTNAADDLLKTDQAGGDVSGTFSNLQIKPDAVGSPEIANGSVTGSKIAQQGATAGQVLKWDGTTWTPQNDIGGGNGDNWGTQTVQTSSALSGVGTSTSPLTLAQQGASTGQVLKWNGIAWVPDTDLGTIYAAGNGISISNNTINNTAPDLPTSLQGAGATTVTGAYPNFTVTTPLPVDNSTTNELQTLTLNGNMLTLSQNGGTVTLPIGPTYNAGMGISFTNNMITNTGDLDGTDDITVTSLAVGDVTGTFSNLQIGPNTIGPNELTDNSVGTNEITDGSIQASDLAVGVIPTTLPPSGPAGGDLSGSYPNPIVAKLQGKQVAPTTPMDGQILRYNGATQQWEPVTDGGNANWSLAGNSGTNPNNDFIGTVDNQPIVFRVNGTERMKLMDDGRLEISGSGLDPLNSNTFIGKRAGNSYVTGERNTFFGYEAGNFTTSGGANTAVGFSTLYNNTSGNNNTAIGHGALLSNTEGSQNTAIGEAALISNTSGNDNTAIGHGALALNSIGYYNTATGLNTLNENKTGIFNTASGGVGALQSNTTGSFNTATGSQALLNNTTGDNNTAVGFNAGPTPAFPNLFNTTAIGNEAVVTSSNTIAIGNTSITSIKGQVGFTTFSDARIKTKVQEDVPGLPFILKLRPVTYHYDIHRQNAHMGLVDTANWVGKYGIEKTAFTGFIAQEVEEAARSLQFDFSGVDAPKNEHDLYGLRYAEFTVPLVKAVQEQQALIETQKVELSDLKNQLTTLQQQVLALLGQPKSDPNVSKNERHK